MKGKDHFRVLDVKDKLILRFTKVVHKCVDGIHLARTRASGEFCEFGNEMSIEQYGERGNFLIKQVTFSRR